MYAKLLPELGAPSPLSMKFLWGDYKNINREVLILDNDAADFELAPPKSCGLDLPHVLLAVEWLAKFHGLCYVAKAKAEAKDHKDDWLAARPWVRKDIVDSSKNGPLPSEAGAGNQKDHSLKNRLALNYG